MSNSVTAKKKKRAILSHPKKGTISRSAAKKAVKPAKKKRASVKRKAAEKTKLINKVLKYMVTDNGHSASASCRYVKVPLTTFLDWVADDPKLTVRYESHHKCMVEMMADELREIADTTVEGVKTEYDEKGKVIKEIKSDMLGHRRLRVDTRKWLLSKIAQKKYGDKVDLDHGTQEGDPIRTLINAVAGVHLQPKDDE